MFAICLIPVFFNLILSGLFLYDKHFDYTFEWLKNQNKTFETGIKGYFNERESDINTLTSNASLMSDLIYDDKDKLDAFLRTLLTNYGYQSLLVLNENKDNIYYEFEYGHHDQEEFIRQVKFLSNRMDNRELGAVIYDNFTVDNQLFGVVGKKSVLENGKTIYIFLTLNNEQLNNLLFSSSFYVDGYISYLVNKDTNGTYYFLTNVVQEEQTFNFGDKADNIPLYWTYADQKVSRDSFVYEDLSGESSLVVYSVLNVLGEKLILVSKVQAKYIISPLLDSLYYIVFGIFIVFLLVLYFSNRVKKLISTNLHSIMNFCSDLINGEEKRRPIVSDYYEVNVINNSLIEVATHLDEDKVTKEYEIKIEKELRLSTDINEFSRKTILIFREMFDVNFAAFYYKAEDEFKLISQYFSSMDQSIPLKDGVIGQCYELNKVLQVEGSIVEKNELLKGAFLDMGSQVLFPKHYIFIPIIASKDSLASGILVGALNQKLTKSQLEFLEKTRVNLALIMSFVKQSENLNLLFEQTKQREAKLDQLNEELLFVSRNDSLTGISNRFHGEYLLEKALKNSSELTLPLSVLMFDVDHFKKYNDTYGHVAGDQCLKKVAQCLNNMGLRNDDFFFRYGGEEFVVALPNTTTKNAVQVAERLRKCVQDLAILHESSPTHDSVTISIGVFTRTPEATHIDTVAQLIQKVDENLYIAKNTRNSVSYGEV